MAYTHRSTSLASALRYRGREGMWTWILHRVTGLGVLLFLLIHVFDTAIVIYWPDLYEHALNLYKAPLFRFAELLIFFSVLFHAANGLRIVVQDFWPQTMLRQRQLVWGVAVVVVVAILPIAYYMLRPIFGLGPEPGADRYENTGASMTVQAPAAPARQGVAL